MSVRRVGAWRCNGLEMALREKIKLETFLMATIMPCSKNRCTEGKKQSDAVAVTVATKD